MMTSTKILQKSCPLYKKGSLISKKLILLSFYVIVNYQDQIWEYDSGSYFIQATDCIWLNIKQNKQSGILNFVSIYDKPTDGQIVEITGKTTSYNIYEKSAIKFTKENNFISDYLTGEWKKPASKCISLNNSIIVFFLNYYFCVKKF